MTLSFKHTFQSAKGDPADTTLVRPSNWNAEHTVTMATGKILGRSTAGTGAVEELAATTSGLAIMAAADYAAMRTLLGVAATPFVTANYTDASVTYAKIQNVSATARLLGRASASAGVMEEITIGTGLTLTGTTISANQGGAGLTNLSIKVATTTTVAVACNTADLYDGTSWKGFGAFATTVNLGTNGGVAALDAGTIAIDTWYHIWLIGKADGTKSVLASTSSTAPTMPSGYTFKKRVGAVQTIHASATLYGTWQFESKARYVVGLAQTSVLPIMASNALGSSNGDLNVPTWIPSSVSRFVPPTAASGIFVHKGNNTYMTAPNNGYGAYTSATNPPPHVCVGYSTAAAELLLESTNIYYANNAGTWALACYGWEDRL